MGSLTGRKDYQRQAGKENGGNANMGDEIEEDSYVEVFLDDNGVLGGKLFWNVATEESVAECFPRSARGFARACVLALELAQEQGLDKFTVNCPAQ